MIEFAPGEGIWPVTVGSWVGLVAGVVALIGVVASWNRASALQAKKQAEDDARADALAKETAAVRVVVEEKLNACRASVDEKLNAFRGSMEAEFNGLGRRVSRTEEEQAAGEAIVTGILQEIAEARAERRHLSDSLTRIERNVDEMRREIHQALKHPGSER
jgi:chromosome segregation ATPase